ncbi:hypothetical protein IC619_008395 [Hazenella sp. IB182353]|uniref:hypothetical protein n=1 Tax=Polycladospora coralii TaxID=2771432 RepID=UPI0017479A72|nr:hypothetical protein [Polycladospora coralii]MBS7530508.1 hypothetical protein [Polycladospora coralii]
MLPDDPEILTNIFYKDGSLRDVYIFDTDEYEWRKFLNLLKTIPFICEFMVNGIESNHIHFDIQDILKLSDEKNVLFIINLDGVKIHCHFFCIEEIELDINPKEINNYRAMNLVFEFMKTISNKLNKEVIITPENMPTYPLLTIYPNGDYQIAT